MSKTIAIHISFYNDRWEKVITEGVRALGYEPRFLNTDEVKLEDIADCEILFGMFPPELLAQCPNLRWMQCSFAGVDKYAKPGVFASPDVVLTNASGAYGITKRPKAVTVRATDRHGNEYELRGTDLLARAICHECDHLDGKLYTDVQIKAIEE